MFRGRPGFHTPLRWERGGGGPAWARRGRRAGFQMSTPVRFTVSSGGRSWEDCILVLLHP